MPLPAPSTPPGPCDQRDRPVLWDWASFGTTSVLTATSSSLAGYSDIGRISMPNLGPIRPKLSSQRPALPRNRPGGEWPMKSRQGRSAFSVRHKRLCEIAFSIVLSRPAFFRSGSICRCRPPRHRASDLIPRCKDKKQKQDPALKGLPITELSPDEAILHALNRLAYGPRPGDIDRVRQMGLAKWIDQQLNPNSIDDKAVDARLENYPDLENVV